MIARQCAETGDIASLQKEVVSMVIAEKVASQMNVVKIDSPPKVASPPSLLEEVTHIQDHLAVVWQKIRDIWSLDGELLFSGIPLAEEQLGDESMDPSQQITLKFSEEGSWWWWQRQLTVRIFSNEIFEYELGGATSRLDSKRVLFLLSKERFTQPEKAVGITLATAKGFLSRLFGRVSTLPPLMGRVDKLTLYKGCAIFDLSNRVISLSDPVFTEEK